MFICIKLRIMHALNWVYLRLQTRIADTMKESGYKPQEIPIPEFDWRNGKPEDLYKNFIRRPHPVILRGFLEGTDILKEFTFDKIMEKYGDEDVILTKREMDGYDGKMKDVLSPKIYLHNSEVLFNKYPEIWESIKSQRLEPFSGPFKCGYAQLFVGRQGTGTPFHSAGTSNWFYMVDGSKKWFFIDPYDSYFCTPLYRSGETKAIKLSVSRHVG